MGCFPCDVIPSYIVKKPFSIIINTDNSANPGSHWVSAFSVDGKTLHYFDSLNLNPNENIQNFLNKFEKIERNNRPFQSILSNVCGIYCVMFIYFMSKGVSFDTFIRNISSIKRCDQYIMYLFNKIFK
jgi:hypothetical protein